MALVPSLWALWNMLWLGSRQRTRLPIGLHGALLPLLLLPGGAMLASSLDILALSQNGVTWFHALYIPYALIALPFSGRWPAITWRGSTLWDS